MKETKILFAFLVMPADSKVDDNDGDIVPAAFF
jgi:hypothetical protein